MVKNYLHHIKEKLQKEFQTKTIANIMNQRNKMEIQGLDYNMKCLDCNSIYIGKTGRKSKARLDELKQDANKGDESKITALSSHIKNTGHVIDL